MTRWAKSPDAPKRRTGRWLQARNARIKMRDKYTCQACGEVTEALEIDHVTPLSQGGLDTDDNLQALCVPCHERKTAQDMGHKVSQGFDANGWPIGGWKA